MRQMGHRLTLYFIFNGAKIVTPVFSKNNGVKEKTVHLPLVWVEGIVFWGGAVGWDKADWTYFSDDGAACVGIFASSGFMKGFPPWATNLNTSPLSSLPLGPVAGMSPGFSWYVSRSSLTAGDINTVVSLWPVLLLWSEETSVLSDSS